MRLNGKNTNKITKKILALLIPFFFRNFIIGQVDIKSYSTVVTGAQQTETYLPFLRKKRVAVITNPTGTIGNTSIVDTLISMKIDVVKIMGPEHGFRGNTEAGDKVLNALDTKTGLPIISLYGNNKKPTKEQLTDVDLVIYDIQDVGVRFYTYISTMCYAMEACAENNVEMIVFDRPNPNGFYVDGPVLKNEYKGFLGLHNVPLVYGMTCGEYAQMVNGEGWLKNKLKCKLTVIPLKNYDRNASYELPLKPSPNIPNSAAILLYPGMGLFEGTIMTVGRGTDFPFQVVGHPEFNGKEFSFTPKESMLSKTPKYLNKICYGIDLRDDDYLKSHPKKINLKILIEAFKTMNRSDFFDKNFNFHAGNSELQKQIARGFSEQQIRKTWDADIKKFKRLREKYLMY
jgi:uncharacterized protein YbbC (DUF1343 family)